MKRSGDKRKRSEKDQATSPDSCRPLSTSERQATEGGANRSRSPAAASSSATEPPTYWIKSIFRTDVVFPISRQTGGDEADDEADDRAGEDESDDEADLDNDDEENEYHGIAFNCRGDQDLLDDAEIVMRSFEDFRTWIYPLNTLALTGNEASTSVATTFGLFRYLWEVSQHILEGQGVKFKVIHLPPRTPNPIRNPDDNSTEASTEIDPAYDDDNAKAVTPAGQLTFLGKALQITKFKQLYYLQRSDFFSRRLADGRYIPKGKAKEVLEQMESYAATGRLAHGLVIDGVSGIDIEYGYLDETKTDIDYDNVTVRWIKRSELLRGGLGHMAKVLKSAGITKEENNRYVPYATRLG